MLGMELKTSKVQFLSFISVTWRMKDVNAKKKEKKKTHLGQINKK